MNQDEFNKQLELAKALVEQWPIWKQNILEYSARPTVAVPRAPVDNRRIAEEGAKPPKLGK